MLNGMYEAHERPAVPDKARIAAHLDTCLYFGCPDVDGAYRHLRGKGLDAEEAYDRSLRHETAVPSRSRRLQPMLPVGGNAAGAARAMKLHSLTPLLNVSEG